MVSSTLSPAVHILGSQNVYIRAVGITDHYWPWAVVFSPLSFCPFFRPNHSSVHSLVHSYEPSVRPSVCPKVRLSVLHSIESREIDRIFSLHHVRPLWVHSQNIITIQHDTADTPEFVYCTARHRPSTADLNGYQAKLFMNAVQLVNRTVFSFCDFVLHRWPYWPCWPCWPRWPCWPYCFIFFSIALLPFCGRIN